MFTYWSINFLTIPTDGLYVNPFRLQGKFLKRGYVFPSLSEYIIRLDLWLLHQLIIRFVFLDPRQLPCQLLFKLQVHLALDLDALRLR